MSGMADIVTLPNKTGRIKRFKITDGTTFDQAIRAFLIAVKERPQLLNEDAGTIVISTLVLSRLATFDNVPGTYIKQK